MHHKRLVVDANILIRAVLGNRVRNLLEKYCENVAFLVAEANAEEASYYLFNMLAAKHNLMMDANSASYCLAVNG